MKSLYFILLIVFPAFLFSQNYNGPESVEGDTLTGNYYVSNPPAGTVLRLLPDGTLENFISGAASPHGLEIVNGVLYVCEGGAVVGYSLTDGTAISLVQTGGVFFKWHHPR